MQRHTTIQKIRIIREQAETNEAADDLLWMEQLAEAGGDEFVEDLMGRWNDAYTVDGRDERMEARAMCRAGFATAYRF